MNLIKYRIVIEFDGPSISEDRFDPNLARLSAEQAIDKYLQDRIAVEVEPRNSLFKVTSSNINY